MTRLGLYGGPRPEYGSFAGKLESIFTPDPDRTFIVAADNRTLIVSADNRTKIIEADDRTLIVQ